MAGQPVTGRGDQPPLLDGVDAGCGAAEVLTAARADLDEHCDAAIATNQVDFALADTIVAADQSQAAVSEKSHRPVFS